MITLLAYIHDDEEIMEINNKLAIDSELNIARKTIKCTYLSMASGKLLTHCSQSPISIYLPQGRCRQEHSRHRQEI